MNRSRRRAELGAPERPITFRAAEELGAFELAQLWADCTAWNLNERTAYDELAELACMSALAKWLARWQPIAIHSAVLAGARIEAIAGALGGSLQAAFDCWQEWASRQRDFIVSGKPSITEDEYETVAQRFASVGIRLRVNHTYGSTSYTGGEARRRGGRALHGGVLRGGSLSSGRSTLAGRSRPWLILVSLLTTAARRPVAERAVQFRAMRATSIVLIGVRYELMIGSTEMTPCATLLMSLPAIVP